MTPWVRATAEWLTKYGETPVTIMGLAIGIATIVFMIFGSFWVKAVIVAYLLTP